MSYPDSFFDAVDAALVDVDEPAIPAPRTGVCDICVQIGLECVRTGRERISHYYQERADYWAARALTHRTADHYAETTTANKPTGNEFRLGQYDS